MTDEAFHHKFGKIWADRTVPKLSPRSTRSSRTGRRTASRPCCSTWSRRHQQLDLYAEFGLDPDKVVEEYGKIMTDDLRRENMKEQTNIFRVLVKTLLNAGIITERTKAFYAMYVDIDELKGEGDRMVGDDIAEEGVAYLREVNFRVRQGQNAGRNTVLAAE
jgi:hypothetical protein